MTHDETLIRDDDLRQQLEDARGKFGFETQVRVLIASQQRRDAERKMQEDRAADLAAMTPMQRRRTMIREVIETEGPSPDNLRFIHSALAICGLPYRRPAVDVREFERKQGRMSVLVEAGKLRTPDGARVAQPLPWGPKARLIIAHLSTEAIRQQSPTVEIADSLTSFMREMGFERTGGPRGNIAPFKEQIQALAACRMEISAWDGKRAATIDTKPFERIEVWLSDNPDQRSLWPSSITFAPRFYETLRSHALPIDVRALRAFANSSRKLDLMFWLNYRLHSMKDRLVLGWKPLQSQFGDGFGRERDFKHQMIEDLAHLCEVFPKLPVKLTERGLELEKADPSVLAIPKLLTAKNA